MFLKARFIRHISKKLYLFSLEKRRLGKIVGYLKIIVKKMVTNGLLYPAGEGKKNKNLNLWPKRTGYIFRRSF